MSKYSLQLMKILIKIKKNIHLGVPAKLFFWVQNYKCTFTLSFVFIFVARD